jgi:hypothetical protein
LIVVSSACNRSLTAASLCAAASSVAHVTGGTDHSYFARDYFPALNVHKTFIKFSRFIHKSQDVIVYNFNYFEVSNCVAANKYSRYGCTIASGTFTRISLGLHRKIKCRASSQNQSILGRTK